MSAASDKWMKEYLASRKGQVGNFMGDTGAQLQVNSQEIRDPANAQDLGSLFRERERLGGLETPIETAGIPIDSPEAQSLLAQSIAQRQGALSRVAADVPQAPQDGPLSRYKAQEREPVDIEAMLARYVPQDGSSNKYLAIAAALARPLRTDSFGEKLGNIADALMTQKQEQQKLRAQYLPAIMTQIAQQQARQENQAYQAEQAYLAQQQRTADMREKNTAKAEQAEQQRAFLQAMAGDKAEAARIQQQTAIASRVQPPEPPAQIITTPDGVFERTRDGALKALVDPSTNKPLSGKTDPQAQSSKSKVRDAREALTIIEEAEKLLPKATGSGIGAAADSVAGWFGTSTEGAKVAVKLKALAGNLVAKMPKMSGPQSDKDVQLYREMAGQIGDASVPAETRMAALATVRQLQQKYADGGASQPTAPPAGGWSIKPKGK